MLSVPYPPHGRGTRQVEELVLLQLARRMFQEGLGRVRAEPKHGSPAPLINELYVNATTAINKLWKERGYDPKYPEQIKARLGYALDRIEAVTYIVMASLHLPLITSEEAQTIDVRMHGIPSPTGTIGKKLAEAKKRRYVAGRNPAGAS